MESPLALAEVKFQTPNKTKLGAWPDCRISRSSMFQVDILPERAHARVICPPKTQKNDWNCCKEHWIC